jgi:hypothetical protein
MTQQASFGLSILLSFVAWGIVVARYVWPVLRRQRNVDALQPLLPLHAFRFVGLAFIVPGVASPDLSPAFARPAAYGDLIATLLALVALASLRSPIGKTAVWVFSVWGTADLLYAFYAGNRDGLQVGRLGSTYFLVTLIVPLLLITHGLIFRLLLQKDSAAGAREGRHAA